MRRAQWRIYVGGDTGGELAGMIVWTKFEEYNSSIETSAHKLLSVCGEFCWSIWTAICSSLNCTDFISVLQQSSGTAVSSQPQGFSFETNGSIFTEVAIPPQKCVATVSPTVTSRYIDINNMKDIFLTSITYTIYNVVSISMVPQTVWRINRPKVSAG